MKKYLERELNPLTFAANQTSTLQLPRDYSYDRIFFRLKGTVYRGVGASAGKPKDLSLAHLVRRIEIRKNGREVIKSIDMATLMRINQIMYGTLPKYKQTVYNAIFGSGAAITNQWDDYAAVTTGANAHDFDICAVLDLGMPRASRRNDTLLDSTARGGVSTLDLIITWGAANDVMTAAYGASGTGVAFDLTPTLAIATGEYIDIDSPDDPYTPYSVFKQYGIQKAITATNTKEQIEIGVGNFYRGFVLKTYADDVQSDTILNNITLRSGTDVIKLRSAMALQGDNKLEYGLETWPTGYYFLDLVHDGHLAKMLNTSNLSSLTLELDVTKRGTNCFVEVFPMEVTAAPVVRKAG